MKILILAVGLLFFSNNFAQKTLGFDLAYCNNTFIQFPNSNDINFSSKKDKFNLDFSVGLSLKNVKLDWMKTDFTLRFERYSGQVSYYSGSPGGGNGFDIDINSSKLNFGIYPIHIHKSSIIHFDLGIEGSFALKSKVKGNFYSWKYQVGSKESYVNGNYNSISNLFTMGLVPRFIFNVDSDQKFRVSPFMLAYIPLKGEFSNTDNTIKSLRFCLGIEFCPSFKKTENK